MNVEAVSGRRALRAFQRVPFDVYRADPNWVPPLLFQERRFLDPRKNPFFAHAEARLFLACDGGRAIGRVAACVDRNTQEAFGEAVGAFGFFEVLEPGAAGPLLAAAETWLRERRCVRALGPMGFTTNHANCGLLVEGFDSAPCLMMSYNPPGYAGLIEAAGYAKAKDLFAYWQSSESMDPRVFRVMEKVRSREGIEVRWGEPKAYAREIETIRGLYRRAWERNWGFVPMTEEEFADMAKELKSIYDPEFLFLATVDGEPAGFCLSLPDIGPALRCARGRLLPFGIFHLLRGLKTCRAVRIILMGIAPEHRRRGIESIFYAETFRSAVRKGIAGGEASWILEDNRMMNQALERLGAKRYKRYRIYGKLL